MEYIALISTSVAIETIPINPKLLKQWWEMIASNYFVIVIKIAVLLVLLTLTGL